MFVEFSALATYIHSHTLALIIARKSFTPKKQNLESCFSDEVTFLLFFPTLWLPLNLLFTVITCKVPLPFLLPLARSPFLALLSLPTYIHCSALSSTVLIFSTTWPWISTTTLCKTSNLINKGQLFSCWGIAYL